MPVDHRRSDHRGYILPGRSHKETVSSQCWASSAWLDEPAIGE
jgi:hypothetical protein